MKPILTSSIVLLACSHVFADCLDPDNPDCQSTNSPPTNSWTAPIYPPGSLQLRAISTNQFGVTNTVPNHIYELQSSSNLINWIPLTPTFTNDSSEAVFSHSPTNDQRYFRAHYIGSFFDYEELEHVTNTATCGGSYIASVDYYRDLNWGYPTNGTVHTIVDPSSNHWIEADGRYGDHYCGFGSVSITNPPSAEYRFILFFKTNAPTTDYPVIITGFTE